MRSSHDDVLSAWLVARWATTRGCGGDEDRVRVQLGDVGGKVVIQVAAGGVYVLHVRARLANLFDRRCTATQARREYSGKAGVWIKSVKHWLQRWLVGGSFAAISAHD